MRKSDLAGPGAAVLDLAQAAGRLPALGPQARVLVAQQEAVGHALGGDAAGFERMVEEAREGVDAAAGSQDAPGVRIARRRISRCRRRRLMQLGQPARAVMVFEREMAGLSAVDSRRCGGVPGPPGPRVRPGRLGGLRGPGSAGGLGSGLRDRVMARVGELARVRRGGRPPADGRRGAIRRCLRRCPANPAGRRTAVGAMAIFISMATSADARSQGAAVAVLPVGSFEQHGDFLPLATDTIVACVSRGGSPRTTTCSCCRRSRSAAPMSTPGSLARSAYPPPPLRHRRRRAGVPAHAGYPDPGPGQRARGYYVLSNLVLEANVTHRCMTLFPVREDWDRARARRRLRRGDQPGHARGRTGGLLAPARRPRARR